MVFAYWPVFLHASGSFISFSSSSIMQRFRFETGVTLAAIILFAGCSTTVVTEEECVLPDVPAKTVSFSGPKTADVAQSYIAFIGKSNIVNHEGRFKNFMVTVTPDEASSADLTRAKIQATIDITSIQTDAEGLTTHLLREEFFASESYPEAVFVSTKIASEGGDRYAVSGDLTIKGIMQEVTITMVITDGFLTMQFDLPRKEFGIGNDSYGDKLLEPLVPVEAKIVFAS